MFQTLNFLLVLFCTIVFAIPTQDEKKDRVINDLSSQEHYPNQHHNLEYDHEAFLGTDEAKTFYQLSPEESRRRLGLVFYYLSLNKFHIYIKGSVELF